MVTRGRGTINQPGQSRSTSQAASGSGIQTLPVGAVFHGSCKLLQKTRSEQASSFHDKLHVDMVSDARLRHPIIFQSSNPAFQSGIQRVIFQSGNPSPIQPSSQASSELSSSQAIQVPSSRQASSELSSIQVPSSLPVLAFGPKKVSLGRMCRQQTKPGSGIQRIIFQSGNPSPIQPSSAGCTFGQGRVSLGRMCRQQPTTVTSNLDPRSPRRTGTVVGLGCSFP